MAKHQQQEVLLILFEKQPEVLKEMTKRFKEGKSVRQVVPLLTPEVMLDVERSARQEMDPTYLAYLVQYCSTP